MKKFFHVILVLTVSGILAACGGSDNKVQVVKKDVNEVTEAELQARVEASVAAAIEKMKRQGPAAGHAQVAVAPFVEIEVSAPPQVEVEEPASAPLQHKNFSDNMLAVLDGKSTVSGNTKPRTALESRDERDRKREDDYRLPGLKDLREQSNLEGKVAIDCIESTGSIALAIECTAAKLTIAELSKCINRPGECFGPDNTMRRRMEYIVQQASQGNFAPAIAPFALPTPDDIKNVEATLAKAQKAAEDAARRFQENAEYQRAQAEAELRRAEAMAQRLLDETSRAANAAGPRVHGAAVGGLVMGPVGLPIGAAAVGGMNKAQSDFERSDLGKAFSSLKF